MSLADQLQKLQIPGQSVIQDITSKSVSLLFDVRTAASLDYEAIQNIGYHGFKELLLIEPAFSGFEQLFSAKSLHFQRNLEQENICNKVKLKIKAYLTLLSPYVLLKPAQKTLEWLVRRYQSHIWDKEALISCILPYHESLFFGRIVQLFGTKPNNDSWDWLLTCQKHGSGFNTQSLINHCVDNRNLLSFICKMADNAKEVLVKYSPKSGLRVVFSFHAKMLTSVIEAMSVVGEEILSFILPFIHSGLKSQVKDFICSTYMIIAAISSKIKLKKDVTKAILSTVLRSIDEFVYEEGLLCFLGIIQLQNVKVLSQRIFKLILNLDKSRFIGWLENLGKEHDFTILVDLLIPLLCKSALATTVDEGRSMQVKSVSMLNDFVDNLEVSQDHIAMICRNLIEECVNFDSEDKTSDVIPSNVQDLLAHLATSYTIVFDECIGYYYLNDSSVDKNKKLQRLKQITTHCLSSEKHLVYGDGDLPFFLGLNHPQKSIRIAAVQELFSTYKSESNIFDHEFFTDAVVARLMDDDPDVVRAVLKYPKSLIKLLPQNTLHPIVMKLMKGSENYDINELIVSLIQGFSSHESSVEINEFVYAIFGQLMFAFVGKRNKKLVGALDSVKIDSSNVVLNGIAKALSHIPTGVLSKGEGSVEMIVNAFSSLIDHVSAAIFQNENCTNVIDDFWNYIQTLSGCHDLHFIGLLVLTSLIEKAPILSGKIMELSFTKYLGQSTLMKKDDFTKLSETDYEDKNKCLLEQYYLYLKSGNSNHLNCLLDNAFFNFLQVVIQSFANNHQNIDGSLLAKQRLFNIISLQAVSSNSSHVRAYHILLEKFLSLAFIDKGEMLLFLCSLYMKLMEKAEQEDVCFKAGVCSLHITKGMLQLLNDKETTGKGNGIIYATHIALLSNPCPLIREIVLVNVKILCGIVEKGDTWGYILEKVKESEKEILLDMFSIKKCWQLAFNKLKDSKHNQFGLLIQKSKKEKSDSRKLSMLHDFVDLLKSYPLSLQIALLDSLELIDPKMIIGKYIHLLKDVLDKKSADAEEMKKIQLLLKSIHADMFDSWDELFPLFVKCMNQKGSQVQMTAFKLITPMFYSKMSSRYKGDLLVELLKILLSSTSVALSTEIRVIIKSLPLATENIAALLDQFCNSFDLMYNSVAPKVGVIEFDLKEEDIYKMPMWRTLGELLDAVCCKETVAQPELLSSKIFHVLERCMRCSGVEFVTQLLLQTLLLITRQDLSKLSEDQFQVELLIQCLQSSSDTHTSHQCLAVLSNAARLYPTRVLHNVMHIFSFMGGTMLRLDDAYSFEVIEKTIDAVVPVLIDKDEKENTRKRPSSSSTDEVIVYILQTFVDSLPHCPEHRRKHIIQHLLKLLQANEYLHMVMILLLKKVTLQHKQVSEEEDMKLSPISLEFCKDLYSTYSVSTQLLALYNMVVCINKTSSVENDTCKVPKSSNILSNVNDKQSNFFNYALMAFILEILQNDDIKSGYDVKPYKQEYLTDLYSQLIEELLSYSDKVGKYEQSAKSKHVQSLQLKVSEVVSQLYALLPLASFITIVSKLLYKENELIRKKSLEFLCKKLVVCDQLSYAQEYVMLQLFDTLVTLVKYKEEDHVGTAVKQLSLTAIKLIAVKLCDRQKEPFLKSVPVITQLYTAEISNEKISIHAMLCVAELSSLLKTDMLPYLPLIMKPLFRRVSMIGSAVHKKCNESLGICVSVLHTVLKSLSKFLSPYVTDFLMNIASFQVAAGKISDTILNQKINCLKEDVGKLFPPRVLYPAIENCFDSLLTTNKEGTVSVIEVYKCSFNSISMADANSNHSQDILNITKKVFDVHTVLDENDDQLCDQLVSISIQAFSNLILKLTENTLHPMFLDLMNWSKEAGISQRLLSFYRLSVALSNSLKSLFLLFVEHVMKNSKDILSKINSAHEDFDENNYAKSKVLKNLVIAVLDMLSNSFFYDSQGFISKKRFESILQPLVSQMDNKIYGDEYLSFAKDHLSPCIVNFAAAVNDPTCWKQLNHKILLKTKSEDEHVRLISLFVIEKIYSRLGESYMILIPETIPFLAEILEDDSIEVEKQCQRVIQEIEDISGESIQKYF